MEFLPEAQLLSRKEKRKFRKKLRRKQLRQDAAKEEELLESNEEQNRSIVEEEIEARRLEAEKAEHDEQEELWLYREEKAREDFRIRQEELKKLEEERKNQEVDDDAELTDEDQPAEIIWQGNEIIVKKRRVQGSPKLHATPKEGGNFEAHSASNPLPPQGAAFEAHTKEHQPQSTSEQPPTFGTEQDKTNCPFHIKTGVCRFGVRCSRVHVYPDHTFTLLMRNMYTGPGLTSENDEGLEAIGTLDGEKTGDMEHIIHSEEELAQHYKEFYEDVHPEFLQFGDLVNFKVCNNTSLHLRGNVYVHYRTEAAAQAAYSAMNGRFYAGKQITCEFVGVTRWRTALCGEYMKFNHRLCSHGTACNFLHCFRNPHDEYDWADWDTEPPRYWVVKMAKLFGREAYFADEHSDHSDGSRRYEYSRSARRESRSTERYRHRSRYHLDHTSSHRTHRRHRSDSEPSESDSDESLRHFSRKGRYEHRWRPNSNEKLKLCMKSEYSARRSRSDSHESFQSDARDIDGGMRKNWRRSPERKDERTYRYSSKHSEHRESGLCSEGEKYSRHKERHLSRYNKLDYNMTLRTELNVGGHGSPSVNNETDSPNSIRPGSRGERENENHSKRRKGPQRDHGRNEELDDSDNFEQSSVDRANNSRKGHRKHRKRRSIERQDRDGKLLESVEHEVSLDIDDRWTGNYEI